MTYITVIKAIRPASLGKSYEVGADGELTKQAVANISLGDATALPITRASDLVKLLDRASKSTKTALMPGRFFGADGDTVRLVTEAELARLVRCAEGKTPGGVQIIGGDKYAARLKRGIEASQWILLDADNPEGIPDAWASMSMQARLDLLEPIVPGISTCERVEYRASSARVVRKGEQPAGATHAWIQISDASKLEVLREHVNVQMQLNSLSFPCPRYSKETGEVIASQARTVIDLAVWVPGRLVFCSRPSVSGDGYYVSDADVTIVNPGGGMLDVSAIALPSNDALSALSKKTAQKLNFSISGGSLTVKDHTSLKWDTPIEVKGIVRSFREVVSDMGPNEKLRCETPFRSSQSEAAFIRVHSDGIPILHDVGTSTTYFLSDDSRNTESWVQEMNAKYAWVEGPKSIYRFEFGDFIKASELTAQYKNQPLIAQGEKGTAKRHCRVNTWMTNPERAQYRNLVFAPGLPAITSSDEINTWRGCAVEPVEGDVAPYERLRDHLFPEADACRYVEQWLAHKLKHPGVKMNTALVVWSAHQGVGKNLLFETVNEIIGSQHSCVIGQKDLTGSFNSWAKDKILVVGDEVLSSGQRNEADQLKGLITGTTLRINEKHQPEYDIANFISFVFLSNHADAVHLDKDSRRYFVHEIKAAPRPARFYADYAAWRDGVGLAALHYYLINDVDLTGFDPKAPAPSTAAKDAMVKASRSGLEQWVADALEDPVGTFGGVVVSAEILKLSYEQATGDRRATLKAISNAAKSAGARVLPSQVRIMHARRSKKHRVMSLADHDLWETRPASEWAEEFKRVQSHGSQSLG